MHSGLLGKTAAKASPGADTDEPERLREWRRQSKCDPLRESREGNRGIMFGHKPYSQALTWVWVPWRKWRKTIWLEWPGTSWEGFYELPNSTAAGGADWRHLKKIWFSQGHPGYELISGAWELMWDFCGLVQKDPAGYHKVACDQGLCWGYSPMTSHWRTNSESHGFV